MHRISDDDIAIVGYAFELPKGINTNDKLWDVLENGEDVIEEIPKDRWEWKKIYNEDADAAGKAYAYHGAFLRDIDKFDCNAFRITPIESHSIDPQQRLVLKTAWRAMENSFIPIEKLKHSNTGVFIGATMDDYMQLQTRLDQGKNINRYTHFGSVLNNIAGRVSFVFGFHGPTITIDTACSSSLVALDSAIKAVKDGDCNIALAGGVNVILTEELYIKFSRTQMLSRTGKCKTFDNSADGYVRGEGCGILVIQKLGQAKAEGKRILAVIRGSSVNHNGNSSGLTVPSGKAQEELISSCMKKAEVGVDDIDYVEAHGTGTQLGDQIEVKALQTVFEMRKNPLLVGSVKTNLGHLESAAGIAGVIKVLISMEKGMIPRSINIVEKNKKIDWENQTIKVAEENVTWDKEIKLAGISSFGASGTNAHVILQKYTEENHATVKEKNQTMALAISAKNKESLLKLAAEMLDFIEKENEDNVRNICRVNNISRSQYPHRVAICADKKSELIKGLEAIISSRTIDGDKVIGPIFSCEESSSIQQWLSLYDSCYQHKILANQLCERMGIKQPISEVCKECKSLGEFVLMSAFFKLLDLIGLKKYKVYGNDITRLQLLCAEEKLTNQDLLQISEKMKKMTDLSKLIESGKNIQSEHYTDDIDLDHESDFIDLNRNESLYYILVKTVVNQFNAGGKINWELLYNNTAADNISIPNYPFNEQSFWIKKQRHIVDELNNPGVLDEFIHSISFKEDGKEEWIFEINDGNSLVNGHIIDNIKVLVGTCQLALVHAFIQSSLTSKNYPIIKDWVFIKKIEITSSVKMRIQLLDEGSQIQQGEISCWNDNDKCWDTKTRFSVIFSDILVAENVLAGSHENTSFFDTELFYSKLDQCGLYLGSEYRILNNINCTNKKIIADITSTELIPAVLDAASQLLYLFYEEDSSLYVPYYFETFTAYGRLEQINRIEVELVEQSPAGVSGNLYYYQNDKLIAKYEGYNLKRIVNTHDLSLDSIVGKCMKLPNGQEIYTQNLKVIGTSLNDHAVYHKLTIPGAYYLSQIMKLAENKLESDNYVLKDINFYNAVVLDETTQIGEAVIVEEKDNQWEVTVSSSVNKSRDFELNAKMVIANTDYNVNTINISEPDWNSDHIYMNDILQIQKEIGLHLSETFNWIQEAWINNNMVQAKLYNKNFIDLSNKYGIPPGLIDTSVQILGLIKNVGNRDEGAYIPLSISKITAYAQLQESMWCICNIIRESGSIIVGNITYYDMSGTMLLEVNEMSLIKADPNKLGKTAYQEKFLFSEKWHPINKSEKIEENAPKTIVELKYGVISNKTILNVYSNTQGKFELLEKRVLDWNNEDEIACVLNEYLSEFEGNTLVLSDSGSFVMSDEIGTEIISNMVRNVTEYYFTVLRVLQNMNLYKCRIYAITNMARRIITNESPNNMIGNVIWGLGRSAQLELKDFELIIADLDQSWQEVFGYMESLVQVSNGQLGLRNGKFYTCRVGKVSGLGKVPDNLKIYPDKTYVVIGGFGALGYKTCEMLIDGGVQKLIIIGKSDFETRQNECKAMLDKRRNLNIRYFKMDVSDLKIEKELKDLLASEPAIGGIIFAAGVVLDKYHANYKLEDIEYVYGPKVNGTYMLARILEEMQIDFCVCYSSIVSVTGSAGQSVYGAANSFQDFICEHMRDKGVNMFTVQWGPWGQVGMFSKVDAKGVNRYEKRNIFTLSPEQALEGLKSVIYLQENTIVANMSVKNVERKTEHKVSKNVDNQPYDKNDTVVDKVKRILAASMGTNDITSIDEKKSFLDIGIDSLMGVEMRAKINKEFKVNLPLELFFDNMSINLIVQALNNKEKENSIVTGEI